MNWNNPLSEWMRKRGVTLSGMAREGDFQREAFIRSTIRDAKNRVHLGTPLIDIPFTVFDLETTGFHPQQGDEILSIGAIRVIKGRVEETPLFHTYVRFESAIPSEITTLTGITNMDTVNAPSLKEALADWLRYIGTSTLVAYGANHDTAFIQVGLKKTWSSRLPHRVIDCLQIVRLLYPDWTDYSLDAALHFHDIPIDGRHTADGDARMTAALLVKLIKRCSYHQIHTLEDLYARLSRMVK
ncbi:DNA polymerase-3 subunit epsilon [Marininema mesophilum]|uniref:DNA polymerase-3 subunit epsilon n=1 Tax=Marininema mesophilum TaxID=1048340 RepID=A0A1H2ZFV2_9BACL|nr:exonuclease domain-containing protein [Marininema mesophilum]SDX16362.1 DNA polymerase-3 subunit epsilon [Marininema mesophilum]